MVTSLMEKDDLPFEWIDISNPEKQELREVAAKYYLHSALVEDSLQPEHLPKYEEIGDVRFLILRVYSSKADSQSDTIQELTDKIAIFIGDGFIITIHRRPIDFIGDIRQRYVETRKCLSPYDVLQKVILSSFLTYERPLAQLMNEIEKFEPMLFRRKGCPPCWRICITLS